jgi:apolipoprotein D and lipocalin family protein
MGMKTTNALIQPTSRWLITALCCSLLAWAPLASVQAQSTETPSAPLESIASLDVPRYMGTWYEVAKYPNWFQKRCIANTSATYAIQPNGMLQVLNRCQKEDGSMSEALGAAKQVGDATSPKLEVRFAPAWLSFLPFVWGNYWVIDLDPQYQLAAVSEPSRKYLWILSRSKTVEPKAYEALLQRLKQQGFNLDAIEISKQTTEKPITQ